MQAEAKIFQIENQPVWMKQVEDSRLFVINGMLFYLHDGVDETNLILIRSLCERKHAMLIGYKDGFVMEIYVLDSRPDKYQCCHISLDNFADLLYSARKAVHEYEEYRSRTGLQD